MSYAVQKDERKIYLAICLSLAEYTCRETFTDLDTNLSIESHLIHNYPSLKDNIHSFRRLKIRAEIDLVVSTFHCQLSIIHFFIFFSHSVSMIRRMQLECSINYYKSKFNLHQFSLTFRSFRLSELVNNPYLRQRQIDLSSFNQNDEQPMKMSSRYIPLLPKDLCHIPLRPVDDDLLANMNKRSRSKGRFPFHLPSFLNKRKFFSSKSSTTNQTASSRNGTGKSLFSIEQNKTPTFFR